jgi:hypothetical protein
MSLEFCPTDTKRMQVHPASCLLQLLGLLNHLRPWIGWGCGERR